MFKISNGDNVDQAAVKAAYANEVRWPLGACGHAWAMMGSAHRRTEDTSRRVLSALGDEFAHMSILTNDGDAPEGTKCAFPFTYNHETYDGCADVGREGVPWCYTNHTLANGDNAWGNCMCEGSTAAEQGEIQDGLRQVRGSACLVYKRVY
jgi:hypothetical protein